MMRWALPAVIVSSLIAQSQAPRPATAPKPEPPKAQAPKPGDAVEVFKIERFPTEPATEAPKPDEPKPVILENSGAPMRVPFSCSDADIAHFGLTCTERHPCPVYLEVANIESLGAKIFVTGNLHNGSSTMFSILLATEDSGKTWKEPVERIANAGLEQIAFLDFESGWITGQTLLALPRDPFFFLTTDGGKSWRRRSVFSESRVASIDHFHFDTKTTGGLVIDRMQGAETPRYEHFESQTGGESWTVKEVSTRPIRLKARRTPNTDWRLNADAAAKAHRVEKRNGTRWETVAAFAIQVGECKPALSALPEPLPAPEPSTRNSAPAPRAPVRRPAVPPTLEKR